jgi:valyl-tRNA synthetase
VDRDFGTGALKITPGHDVNDFAIGQRHGLGVLNVMNKDGTMNELVSAHIRIDPIELV